MKAIKSLRAQMAFLLAADTTTLAQAADNNMIALIMAPFTPSETLTFASLTLATFDGSTPILVGLGTQPSAYDPLTDDVVISLKPPVGGFRFETTGTTHLPQTIFGFALLNEALDALLAAELLPVPITLTGINQGIDLNDVEIRELANILV